MWERWSFELRQMSKHSLAEWHELTDWVIKCLQGRVVVLLAIGITVLVNVFFYWLKGCGTTVWCHEFRLIGKARHCSSGFLVMSVCGKKTYGKFDAPDEDKRFSPIWHFSLQMRLIILEDYEKASDWAARYIKKRIHDFKPGSDRYFTLGLPTGLVIIVTW